MSNVELHRNHKMFLGFAAIVFLGSGVGAYFIWKDCEQLDLDVVGLQTEIDTARGKIAKIDALEKQVIILRENLQEYVRILPNDDEVNDFYRTLQGFATDSGITITDINPQAKRGKVSKSKVFETAEYTLKFKATYGEFLQFINDLENYERFVSITNINAKAGDLDEDEPGDPQHTFDLNIASYIYMGNEVAQGVSITGYERKRAQLFEQIQEARHDLTLERFQLLANTVRRDPMVDPRVRITSEAVAGADLEEQRNFVEQTLARIEECEALFSLMDRAPSVMREMELRVEGLNMLAEIQARVDDALTQSLITEPSLKREFDRRILPELARLRQQAGPGDVTRPDQERIRMQQSLAQMEQAFEQANYEGCVKAFEVLASLGTTASVEPDLADMQQRMEALYLASTTAIEFQQMELAVSGLVRYPDRESVAIVNHVVYREGEALDDDLFLLEIHDDHLVFEFRGVSLIYDL